MDPEITPTQQKQLGAWATQRDAILLEISVKKAEAEIWTKKNIDLANSNTEITTQVHRAEGRLEELAKQQQERASLIPTEIADLEKQKTLLESRVTDIREIVDVLKDQEKTLIESLKALTETHDKVFERINGLEGLIQGIVRVSSENGAKVNNILVDAGLELQKIIRIAEENVIKTNRLIQEVPKIVVDLHRDVIERKKFNKNRSINVQQ